jgi:hypothetical protein
MDNWSSNCKMIYCAPLYSSISIFLVLVTLHILANADTATQELGVQRAPASLGSTLAWGFERRHLVQHDQIIVRSMHLSLARTFPTRGNVSLWHIQSITQNVAFARNFNKGLI